jgi:hypothetical protein
LESNDDQIKKTVGKSTDKNPLQKLKEIKTALRKLGCKNVQDNSETIYRKIVGQK